MSEPTLYQIDWQRFEEEQPKAFSYAAQSDDYIVPVERCEHGNIDGHYAGEYIDYSHGDQRRYTIWCPGAGIGGDDGR